MNECPFPATKTRGVDRVQLPLPTQHVDRLARAMTAGNSDLNDAEA